MPDETSQHKVDDPHAAHPPQSAVLSEADRARNAVLLAGYDYSKYPEWITGFNGMNLQRVARTRYQRAVRVRVGERGNYKGVIARLSDDELVLAACRRKTAAGLFEIRVYASRDRAESWTQINRTQLLGKEMCLVALPDDTLVMTVESKMFLEDKTRMAIYRSSDRGRCWDMTTIEGPSKPRSMWVEPDGSLLMARDLASAYHAPLYASAGSAYEPSPDLEVLRSSDGGQTWNRARGTVNWSNSCFGEVSVVRLANGNLLAALRSNPPGTQHEAFQVTFLTESTDDGGTWCQPWIMTNTAEVQVYLTILSEGRLLGTYTNYQLPFGVCAVVSDDAGRTWSTDEPIQLAMSADTFTGWATTVELSDGALVTSYAITAYLNEPREPSGAERNVCETVRWRLPSTAL